MLLTNTGRGYTSNTSHVYSVEQVKYKKNTFILTSGDKGKVDIFNLESLLKNKSTSKINIFIYLFIYSLFTYYNLSKLYVTHY